MNKKVNTLFFIIGATIFNLLLMAGITIGLIFLVILLVPNDSTFLPIALALTFVFAIGLSFYLYSSIMKYLSNKVDLDKYLHPIFKTKNKR